MILKKSKLKKHTINGLPLRSHFSFGSLLVLITSKCYRKENNYCIKSTLKIACHLLPMKSAGFA